jgi:GxxExxY protein
MKGRTREFSDLSHRVIGCAIEVHRVLGPGLLESTYRRALEHELKLHGLAVATEQPLPIVYKGLRIEGAFRIDLLVAAEIIVEIKCVATFTEAHHAQILTYLKLTGLKTGYLMNFTQPRLMDGLVSFVL